ncbi:(2Fe-2S)-binding protein [Burkholderia sp. BCC1977]|uniref:(2Fe-2S)-binding protein n=1 Tax=Burkholderia sp. BCC1977 TaxID=2817440 RepID=UPI0039F200F2
MAMQSTNDDPLRMVVNGIDVIVEEASPETPLLYVLRNDMGLNGPKYGCGVGQCGACSVLVDGVPTRSCVVPVRVARDRNVTTIEGLGSRSSLHPVQSAFVEEQAAQCGYCLNGMIISTVALFASNPCPSDAEIKEALKFNLCRCGAHVEILHAVRRAVQMYSFQSK